MLKRDTPIQASDAAQPLNNLSMSSQVQSSVRTEEENVLGFVKRYLGLLAAAGSAPLLASGLTALTPPEFGKDQHSASKMVGAASLLSVSTLAICLMCRDVIDDITYRRGLFARLTPACFASVLLAIAVIATAGYIDTSGTNSRNPICRITCYLVLWICISGALGIAVTSTYSLFYGSQVQKAIDSLVLGKKHRDLVSVLVATLGTALKPTLPSRKTSEFIAREIERRINTLVLLGKGNLTVANEEILETQSDLLKALGPQFQAVSDREISWWIGSLDAPNDSGSNRLSRAYFRLHCTLAAPAGANSLFSRIFVIEDVDIETRFDQLHDLLNKHSENCIGWSIAFFEQLSPELKDAKKSLGFALIGNGEAVCFFSNLPAGGRRMTVVFPGEENSGVKEYLERHLQLAQNCWLCSAGFLPGKDVGSNLGSIEPEPLRKAIDRSKSIPIYKNLENSIPIVKEPNELRRGLEFIRDQRRKNRAAYLDFDSPYVAELVGDWNYSFSGKVEDEGVSDASVKLGGACTFTITGRTLSASGVRNFAEGLSLVESTRPVKWTSNQIRFTTHDGKPMVELDYRMDSEGGLVTVTCEISAVARSEANGQMAIYMRGKVVRGQIEFKANRSN
jgi:hypothetical protein